MEVNTYEGSTLVNNHLVNFLRYLFMYQPWEPGIEFSWQEDEERRTIDIYTENPEISIRRPTIFIDFPTFSNTLISFDAKEGMALDSVDVKRVYNIPYTTVFRAISFNRKVTAGLLDILSIVLVHPQFCSAFEKATNIRSDLREGNFRRGAIVAKPATGTSGSSGSLEYEGTITGVYNVMLETSLRFTEDPGTIAKEYISFTRE